MVSSLGQVFFKLRFGDICQGRQHGREFLGLGPLPASTLPFTAATKAVLLIYCRGQFTDRPFAHVLPDHPPAGAH